MAIPVTNISILRVLLQIETTLMNLQRDMNGVATNWKQIAIGGTVPVETVALHMNTAANTWQTRLDAVTDFQTNNPVEFPNVVAMWNKLGGTSQEFTDTINPLQTVVTQLGAASKTTYAELEIIADQILAQVDPPLTVWDE